MPPTTDFIPCPSRSEQYSFHPPRKAQRFPDRPFTGKSFKVRSLIVGAALVLVPACEFNPVDAAIDAALDFEELTGAFEAEDGMIIEADGEGDAFIRRLGSTKSIFADFKLGDTYLYSVHPVAANEYAGYMRGNNGLLGSGTVVVDGDRLVMSRTDGTAPVGHTIWRRTTYSGGGSTGGGTGGSGSGNGGGTSGSIVLLYQTGLSGEEHSSTYVSVTVPSGTKKLVVETSEDNEYGRNLGDLFVSYGTRPTASHYPYTWSAQCASVESNRANETCTFTNPTPGTWHILLYGYHAFRGTTLKVTIDK